MITDIEEALRAEMAVRAETARLRPDFHAAVERGVTRDRIQRRVAGGSALVLLLGVGIVASAALHGGIPLPTNVNPPMHLARFPLLQIPTRGSLACDAAFAADATRVGRAALTKSVTDNGFGPFDPSSFRLLYAGDDGVLRFVVVAGLFADRHADDGQGSNASSFYEALIGPSGAPASALRAQGYTGSSQGETTFAFTGESTGPGKPTPLVVLGPTRMTDVEYSAGVTLDSGLRPHRVGVSIPTVDGAAIGEIPGTDNAATAYDYATSTVFKAELNGRTIYDIGGGSSTPAWVLDALSNDPAIVAAHQDLQNLLIQKASAAGMTLGPQDVLTDSSRMALDDLAAIEHLSTADLHYSLAWIGLEKPGMGAVVLDVTVSGLPELQLFVDGTVGHNGGGGLAPDPLIRIAPKHGAGQVPKTRAQFTGGVGFELSQGSAAGGTW